jgi:hypothetical protein
MIELFKDGIHTRFYRPINGCSLFASKDHMTKKHGEFLGKVKNVDGDILTFEINGQTDKLIWSFKDGRNKWIEFGV